jgi:amidase
VTTIDVQTAGLDATAQAALVRSGEVSAAELVEAAIGRIEALNPTLNAVVTTMYDEGRAAVAAGLPDGPFTGVPFLVKDLCAEVAGVPFAEGSRYLRDFTPTEDQELVRRHRKAGLVLLGKTATPEFGMLPTAESARHGATANPWDVTRTAGGSSGGSAAAVASGMVPFAHGNDAGGSIRFPASCCGLFGFKPTRARNPLGPRYGDVFSGLVVEHALTRSVRDSAALLDATSGPMLGDPYLPPAVNVHSRRRWGANRVGCGSASACARPVATRCTPTASRPCATRFRCWPSWATWWRRRTCPDWTRRSAPPSAPCTGPPRRGSSSTGRAAWAAHRARTNWNR